MEFLIFKRFCNKKLCNIIYQSFKIILLSHFIFEIFSRETEIGEEEVKEKEKEEEQENGRKIMKEMKSIKTNLF